MKKVRFILALVLALTMVLGAPLSVFAAVHDNVTTSNEVATIFESDPDAEVVINLGGDIAMEESLSANAGQNYTINGNGNSIANVVLSGTGSVEINADIVSQLGEGLMTDGGVNVTVNGDITAEVDGIQAEGDSVVTVTGDVTGGSDGIIVYDNASVTVTGNVTAEEDQAIDAQDNGSVTVTGNVTSKDDVGIDADYNATVTVVGDVTGGSGYLDDLSDPEGFDDGSVGIEASGNSEVTVTGNVTGGDSMGTYGYGAPGVMAYDTAKVTVNGDVTGGSVTADPNVVGETSMGGDGLYVGADATVTVNGNVTGGDTNGYGGLGGNGIALLHDGADAEAQGDGVATGSVTVNGTVTGGTGGEDGKNGAALSYGVSYNFGIDDVLGTEAADLTEEQKGMLESMIYELVGSEEITGEEELAYAEVFFGTTEPDEDAITEEQAWAFLQFVIAEELAQMIAEQDYPDVSVWELSDASGIRMDSMMGQDAAAAYSAENTAYIIRVTQPKGGTITVDKENALEGETITITVKVDEGYVLKSVSCGVGEPTDNGDGTYSFVVPTGGGVEVSAVLVSTAVTPNTGDSFSLAFFTVLAAVSLLGICALSFSRKKAV